MLKDLSADNGIERREGRYRLSKAPDDKMDSPAFVAIACIPNVRLAYVEQGDPVPAFRK